MNFKNYFNELDILDEALKIVRKKDEIISDEIKIDLSYFDNIEIIRTTHTKEIRDGQDVPRDKGLRDSILLKTVKKAWKKGLKNNTKTMITYKEKKKYNMIVIEWLLDENKIILITSIQDRKESPKAYFREKHKNTPKILTESYNIIELEDI